MHANRRHGGLPDLLKQQNEFDLDAGMDGALALVAQVAAAKCNRDLPVGSQLLACKTITAWIEQGREQDGYQGCTFGRVLVFEDRTGVACTSGANLTLGAHA